MPAGLRRLAAQLLAWSLGCHLAVLTIWYAACTPTCASKPGRLTIQVGVSSTIKADYTMKYKFCEINEMVLLCVT